MTKLEWALKMAKRGFNVFPLRPMSKKPAIPGWPVNATQNIASLELWWGRNPDFNIGVSTAGLLVLDVDNKNGKNGSASLDALLIEQAAELPATFTVHTPTGGSHLYYGNAARDVGNSVEKLGEGLDVRATGGYVVGPGSVVTAGIYEVKYDRDPPAAPEWMADLARAANVPKTKAEHEIKTPAAPLDQDHGVSRAITYLLNDAPSLVKGAGCDAGTYAVAAKVKDFGVSEIICLQIMLDHWNDVKVSPPWPFDKLRVKVGNVYTYGRNAPGSADPSADFPDDLPPTTDPFEKPPIPPLTATLVEPYDPADLPPRPWLVYGHCLRGFVSVLVADPGGGKTTFTLALALAIATGRGEIAGVKIEERGGVWLYNNEDDEIELKRRLSAFMTKWQIPWSALEGRLFIDSGVERPLCIARRRMKEGNLQRADVDDVIATIQKNGISLFVADPFLETHEGDENSNRDINSVGRLYREIATRGNCSVLVVHHTNKPKGASDEGRAGNMHAARGASALMGVARIAKTLVGMSETDAKGLGIPPDNRNRYVRLDDAKANLTLGGLSGSWYRRESILMPNLEDEVGILVPVSLKSNRAAQDEGLIRDIIGYLGTPGEAPLATLAKDMTEAYPAYHETKQAAFRKRVVAATAGGKVVDGVRVTVGEKEPGAHGSKTWVSARLVG